MQTRCECNVHVNYDDDDNYRRDGETERGDNEETFDALIN